MTRADLNKLLQYAVENDASALHLSSGVPPAVRIDGALRKLDLSPLEKEHFERLLPEILPDQQKKAFSEALELDFAYAVPGVARFRTNVFRQLRGPGVALRVIPEKVRSLEALRCPEGIYRLARERKGIVLVTGPTGCGKTTTLAAMLDLINRERREHILTIEDPIEYVHQPQKCLINQRELGEHTSSFAHALRAALREDPDVILVGEMRDLETISLALTAAETGHLVFATLHTMNAAETVNRIVDVFPSEQQQQARSMFSNSVMGIVAQRLLPKACGAGRVAVHEIMVATTAVRNLIREDKSHQIYTVIQTGGAFGMQTIDQALASLYKRGIISAEIAEAQAHDRQNVLMA
ncbi:MAG: type IV pilus twitching motility protein PilT [bacterium]